MSTVHVQNLSVTYPDGREALRDVSFSVAQGESLAILGANGAGKSTLLLALVGVLKGSGEIIIADQKLSASTLPEIRCITQLVFQDPNDQLFMPVLRDDVAFGPLNFGVPRKEIPKLVTESLETVGLRSFEDRNPFNMSAGERKRAALATVFACNPQILLLDEPTSGLDPRGRRELGELLNGSSCTKLIATHDLQFAKETCGRAIVIINGRIAATGNIERLLDDVELIESSGLR